MNPHNLFRLIRRTDYLFLLLNGLLLLIVTTIPFATSLLATYLLLPDKRAAQVIFLALPSTLTRALATSLRRERPARARK